MGFFSWKTMDTNESIRNVYTEEHFPVKMVDNKGNVWVEKEYDGYGVFGGKDYYELLAEMNGLEPDRSLGIQLEFSGEKFISPNLVTSSVEWGWIDKKPETCPDQGYFY